MINRKRALILIIIIGLLLIALIIYLVWFKNPKVTTPEVPTNPALIKPEISTNTPGTKPRNYQQYDISKEAPHELNANDLGKIGMNFAERFGSFSKQSNYGNIEDAKLFMTKDLAAWADSYALKLRSDHAKDTYYDIITKALSFKASGFDNKAGTAVITINTLRRESTEAVNNATAYSQNLTLNFVRVNNDWLINAAYWEKK